MTPKTDEDEEDLIYCVDCHSYCAECQDLTNLKCP